MSLTTDEINIMPSRMFASNLRDCVESLSTKLNKQELDPLLKRIEQCSLAARVVAVNYFLNQLKIDLKNPELATELRISLHS